ncbi:30S ribosomal protein S1 [Longirhabdus pacifica]|uniref:30S ribosomal protein S1 n=1 Tax=Longirhabdus pacifica TaxID=2305227 RepID=UPI0010087E4C|nr:30S ribosomal protein S1 [Longirhabdus pacifica]
MTEELNKNEVTETEAKTDIESAMKEVSTLKAGDAVTGKIVKIDDDQVFVDIGYKYDGIIPIRELSSVKVGAAEDAVKVDQTVEAKIISVDDEKEQLILSKRAIDGENAWEQLEEKLNNNEIFEATVADVVKGGLVVDVGIRGFVPASMVELHFVEDFSDYQGRTLRLKVKELDKEANKVILSQKDVLQAEQEETKKEVMGKLEVGQELEGTVQRLTKFGAFVDIGGVDGLVHISELSWKHVKEPSEVVKEGDKVNVKVLKVEQEAGKISLSMKQAQPGPWESVTEDFSEGTEVEGTVKRIADFGAFVELKDGVEGLVHISQIANKHISTPHEVLTVGNKVNVKILEINTDAKRISLSIKETAEAKAQNTEVNENVELTKEEKKLIEENNQGLTMTLGERFGDKLSKFK